MRHSPWMLIAAALAAGAIFVSLCGCQETKATNGADGPDVSAVSAKGAAAARSSGQIVDVHAYINVTSGCQADTVDLLERLAQENADRVRLTITDFGSSEGAREWLATGLGCMAILFDGKPAVALPSSGQPRIVIFQLPVGQGMWTHEDLRATFDAIRAGTFRTATDQEVEEFLAPTRLDIHVIGQKAEDLDSPGKPYGQVVLDGEVIMVFTKPEGRKSPTQRAAQAASALGKWLASPVLPTDVGVEVVEEGSRLVVADIEVATATDADVAGSGLQTRQLAQKWAGKIGHAVMVARARVKMAEQAKAASAEPAAAQPAQ